MCDPVLNFILWTPRVNELSNVFCRPVSVTKNQGERNSAFLWMFVETSHEMYFSTTNKWINKKIVLYNILESSVVRSLFDGLLQSFNSCNHLWSSKDSLSFSGFRCHHVMSSHRFRNFINCHNLCVVLFLAWYSIRHFTGLISRGTYNRMYFFDYGYMGHIKNWGLSCGGDL